MSYESLLRETITIAPLSSSDAYDKPTHGTAITEKCRTETMDEVLNMADGSVALLKMAVFVLPTTTATKDSQITMADGSQPRIFAIKVARGRNGAVHHKKLLTGVKRSP